MSTRSFLFLYQWSLALRYLTLLSLHLARNDFSLTFLACGVIFECGAPGRPMQNHARIYVSVPTQYCYSPPDP